MESALPFLIRASAANYAKDSPITRNLGDQAFLFASFLELDEPRLAELGIRAKALMTTSERSWTMDWRGGWIPQSFLVWPPAPSHEKGKLVADPRLLPHAALAILFEGTFPLPAAPSRSNRSRWRRAAPLPNRSRPSPRIRPIPASPDSSYSWDAPRPSRTTGSPRRNLAPTSSSPMSWPPSRSPKRWDRWRLGGLSRAASASSTRARWWGGASSCRPASLSHCWDSASGGPCRGAAAP